MKILVIGHSHIHALKLAYESDQLDWPEALSFEFLPLRSKENFSIFLNKDLDDHAAKTRELINKIKDSDAILISFFGNAYHIVSLANNPVPFDFICGDDNDHRSNENVTFIPKTLMDVQMKNFSFKLNGHIESLKNIMPDETPIYYLSNPAPIGSETRISSYPGNDREKFDEYGISPPEMRLKFWQLHEETVKSYCTDADIEYLPAPACTLDKAGMLKDEYCAHDPIHGNAAYGQLILENFIAKLNIRGQ